MVLGTNSALEPILLGEALDAVTSMFQVVAAMILKEQVMSWYLQFRVSRLSTYSLVGPTRIEGVGILDYVPYHVALRHVRDFIHV